MLSRGQFVLAEKKVGSSFRCRCSNCRHQVTPVRRAATEVEPIPLGVIAEAALSTLLVDAA
jgi:hypothetical protein